MFIAKYDNSGNLLWVKSAGESYRSNSVSTDRSGNVFVLIEMGTRRTETREKFWTQIKDKGKVSSN